MNLLLFVWVAGRYVYKDVPHATKRHVGGLALKPPRGPVPPWALPHEMPIRGQASPPSHLFSTALKGPNKRQTYFSLIWIPNKKGQGVPNGLCVMALPNPKTDEAELLAVSGNALPITMWKSTLVPAAVKRSVSFTFTAQGQAAVWCVDIVQFVRTVGKTFLLIL